MPPALAQRAAAAVAALPVPEHDPERVRRATEEVLSRPEFQQPPEPLLSRILDWVGEGIARVLGLLFTGGTGSVVSAVVLALLAAAVAVIVARFARGVSADPGVRTAVHGERRRTAGSWRDEAAEHERAGRWRQAVRCRYRALVADLAERGLVDEVPGRTAGEYRAEVRRNLPAAATDFAGATELFELAWYGHAPTGGDAAARFRDLADRALAKAGT